MFRVGTRLQYDYVSTKLSGDGCILPLNKRIPNENASMAPHCIAQYYHLSSHNIAELCAIIIVNYMSVL